jgi:hypothetical protein
MDFRSLVQASTRVLPAAYALFLGLNAEAGTAAQPQPRGVPVAFGNTVKALYPDGKHQRIWIKADGTWDAIGRRGKPSSGKWTQKGEKVCLKQVKPFPAPFSYCTRFPADGGVGAVWTSKDMAGEPIKLTVVKGIERP